MLWRTEDTIAPIASAAGGALRGIVRMSGPHCLSILAQCLPAEINLTQRTARMLDTSLNLSAALHLPVRLYLWPGERSYTRQPTVEIHTLGSPPLLDRVLRTLCQLGARLAEPGEFTLRAFLAGRLDLTQAEAVLGVIDADSQRDLRIALQQLAGGMSTPLSQLRSDLLNLLADVEAELDFVEEDIEFIGQAKLRQQLSAAYNQTSALLARVGCREASTSQARIVLYGTPNAGKSSLFNALTENGQALVSPIAGTTRDYLSAEVTFAGLRCLLLDTAGANTIEFNGSPDSIAQEQLREQHEQARLRVLCIDATQPLDAWTIAELARDDEQRLIVFTKCDLATEQVEHKIIAIRMSSRTGAGLPDLAKCIAEKLTNRNAGNMEVVDSTAVRCRESLASAVEHLNAAQLALESGLSREFLAGDVRLALAELGRVAGTVVTDDILDRIFSRFCIGK